MRAASLGVMRMHGDKRDICTDEFMTGVAPWMWHRDVAASHEPELLRLAWRTLQVGVASSCNERLLTFSAWKLIIGGKRTRLGSKRQREQVSTYTNSSMLKKYNSDVYADYGSAVASGSDDSDSDCGP